MPSWWLAKEYRKDSRADTSNQNQGYSQQKSLLHQENKVEDEETLWFKRSWSNLGRRNFGSSLWDTQRLSSRRKAKARPDSVTRTTPGW